MSVRGQAPQGLEPGIPVQGAGRRVPPIGRQLNEIDSCLELRLADAQSLLGLLALCFGFHLLRRLERSGENTSDSPALVTRRGAVGRKVSLLQVPIATAGINPSMVLKRDRLTGEHPRVDQ